jgi:hypothetical protein
MVASATTAAAMTGLQVELLGVSLSVDLLGLHIAVIDALLQG